VRNALKRALGLPLGVVLAAAEVVVDERLEPHAAIRQPHASTVTITGAARVNGFMNLDPFFAFN
jgi:hypothetical protein